jgi:Ras-related protein Rab-39B
MAVAGTEVVVVIAANKCDLEDHREVPAKEAADWAMAQHFPIYETSAKSGQGIAAIFDALSEAVVRASSGLSEGLAQGQKHKCC